MRHQWALKRCSLWLSMMICWIKLIFYYTYWYHSLLDLNFLAKASLLFWVGLYSQCTSCPHLWVSLFWQWLPPHLAGKLREGKERCSGGWIMVRVGLPLILCVLRSAQSEWVRFPSPSWNRAQPSPALLLCALQQPFVAVPLVNTVGKWTTQW